jgi:hypothetical protein
LLPQGFKGLISVCLAGLPSNIHLKIADTSPSLINTALDVVFIIRRKHRVCLLYERGGWIQRQIVHEFKISHSGRNAVTIRLVVNS